ncbi:MAG: hypothetical protein EOP00_37090 [Pedobacter sp.]|nr:MAG: hypothetical protein EOP00_37090 [Pedobacter sp.]
MKKKLAKLLQPATTLSLKKLGEINLNVLMAAIKYGAEATCGILDNVQCFEMTSTNAHNKTYPCYELRCCLYRGSLIAP